MEKAASHTTKRIAGSPLKKRGARLIAVQVLYSIDIDSVSGKTSDEKLLDIISMYENELSDMKISKSDQPHIIKLARFVSTNREEVDSKISANLLDNWKIERLPKVVIAILRCGVAELFMDKELDKKVVISEYLEIAKSLNHVGESGFINLVLDRVSEGR